MTKINNTKKSGFSRIIVVAALLLSIAALLFAQTSTFTIYIIGDSTVCNYADDKYPWKGWGQVFSYFFNNGTVTIDNRAIGGRSSKSFYVEGRWTTVKDLLKSGDFVFIQFGHNDRDYTKEERYADTTLYKSYLRLYVNESRAKGAIPVFVTPMNMNTWNGTALREVFTERDKGADYRGAMINVANELKVPLIDLEKKSAAFMKTVGQAYCTSFHFMGLQPGEYPNYPDGYSDGTHFQEMGALINARMVAEGVKELSTHADVGKLAAVLAPLNKVTIIANKASTGLVTVSGDFPAGVTVTAKVMPNTGETFQNWADASGKNVSNSRLYMFTMGNAPVTYYAMFKGGSAVDIKQPFKSSEYINKNSPEIAIKQDDKSLVINCHSKIQSVSLYNLNGKCLKSIVSGNYTALINMSDIKSGNYCLTVNSAAGSFNSMIHRE